MSSCSDCKYRHQFWRQEPCFSCFGSGTGYEPSKDDDYVPCLMRVLVYEASGDFIECEDCPIVGSCERHNEPEYGKRVEA